MRILIYGGVIVNEGRQERGSLIVDHGRIEDILLGDRAIHDTFDRIIDASESIVLPGVIDSHVHFREPGLTAKGDIQSESRAAAYGGVTTFFDMPNTLPPTVDASSLDAKRSRARQQSRINYSFFPAATADNEDYLRSADKRRIPGVKLFLGATTGNMSISKDESIEKVFKLAAERGLIVVAHCEDNTIIERNMKHCKEMYSTDDPPIAEHYKIRSAEACFASSSRAAAWAKKYGAHLHIAHLSTERELALLTGDITGEVCASYLLFDSDDYTSLGARIKCNPAIKTAHERRALINAVREGQLTTLSTDHAPHLLSEKEGGAARALSGIPMIQFSLPAVLTLADEEGIPLTRVVELMCHAPTRLFSIAERGFLRKGYKADIAIAKRQAWTIDKACIQSKCGWSPLEGKTLSWQVSHTLCNGELIYDNGTFADEYRGEEIMFNR